jgi:hemerythrin-like metal-binding protein
MSLLTWSHQLSVGYEEIDSQHKVLVEIINSLHDHMVSGDANENIGKVLDRMIEYTVFHFRTEEQLMAGSGYSGAQAHVEEHRKLVEKAVDLQARFKAGTTTLTIEVMAFLRDWLQHHIKESDKALGRHLAGRAAP